jgi:hypothetical protein
VFAGYIFVGQKSGDKAKGEKGGRALGRSLWWRVRAQPRRLFVGFACGLFFFKFFRQKSQDETLDTSAKFQTKKNGCFYISPKKKTKKMVDVSPKEGNIPSFSIVPCEERGI